MMRSLPEFCEVGFPDFSSISPLSYEEAAVKDVCVRAKAMAREGNFVDSALAVAMRNALNRDLSNAELRLFGELDESASKMEGQIANIRAFQRLFGARNIQRTFVEQPGSGVWPPALRNIVEGEHTGNASGSASYWRKVRDDLSKWFGLSLADISRSVGISYATFANLGKHRPQGRTIRPILLLHGLAKACLDSGGEAAQAWLKTIGRDCLSNGLEKFEIEVNRRLFEVHGRPRMIHQEDEVSEVAWLPLPRSYAPVGVEGF